MSEAPSDSTNVEQRGWFARLRAGLSRSSSRLSDGISGIFVRRRLDDEALDALELVFHGIHCCFGPRPREQVKKEPRH